MSSIPIIRFMFVQEWSVLNDALAFVPQYETDSYQSASDLISALSADQAGMIVASLRDKNDLIQIATLVKLMKKLSPTTFVKVIVVNFSSDKQYEKAIAKLGIQEVVDGRIQTKALRYKIDFMMKSVNVHLKKMGAAKLSSALKSAEAAKTQERKSSDLGPVWKDSLDCEDDIWLLKNENDCKKVLTRWLLKLMGPSPYVAQWSESNIHGVWKFEFKEQSESFISSTGTWFYRGDQKPDFDWGENLWSFAGSEFDLFYKTDAEVLSRVCLKEKHLIIAENSIYAQTKEQKIIESFDKDLIFRNEHKNITESGHVDKDVEKYRNLEGHGKTDSLKHNALSGRGSTSHLETNPYSLGLSPGINSGSNLEQDLEKIPLGSVFTVKKDGVSDNLRGQSSTDQLQGHLKSTTPRPTKKDSNFISVDDFDSDNGKDQAPLAEPVKRQNKIVEFPKKAVANSATPILAPSKEFDDSIENATVTSVLSQDLVRVSCKLDDHFDNTIIFMTAKAEFNLNKPVNLNLNFNYMGRDSTLKFSAKIVSVDSDDEGLKYITVEMSPENLGSFNSFMKLFGTRQQNIDYFLKAAKGY